MRLTPHAELRDFMPYHIHGSFEATAEPLTDLFTETASLLVR
jgi:hypothetical protein